MKWFISWPLLLCLFLTIPNCNNPRFEKFFILTFVMSTVWIAAFSYIMVWMVCLVGYTLGIPDTIMGITFLAAGTSVPDTIASVMVARNGYGDMAVSNSIGSNVFDILLGLGLPWFLSTTLRPNGAEATVSVTIQIYGRNNDNLTLGPHQLERSDDFCQFTTAVAHHRGECLERPRSESLFIQFILKVSAIKLNGWKLDKRLGIIIMLSYVSFLILSILVETNVFFPVNLPTCIVNWPTCHTAVLSLEKVQKKMGPHYPWLRDLIVVPELSFYCNLFYQLWSTTKIHYVYIYIMINISNKQNTYTHTHTVLQPIQSELYILYVTYKMS